MARALDKLFGEQKGHCFYCGVRMILRTGRGASITREHRHPKSLGGSNGRRNVVGACQRCNCLKGQMTEAEFRAKHSDAAAIEAAEPMLAFDARWVRGQEKGRERQKRNQTKTPVLYRERKAMQKTIDAMSKPEPFVGKLHPLNADGETVAVFHPKEKT